MDGPTTGRALRRGARAVGLAALMGVLAPDPAAAKCGVTAEVVAFDAFIWYNRLGAHDPAAMMYALEQDVRPKSGTSLSPGNVELREGKRPRPIVLRVNEGDCIQIEFTNYLDPDFSGDGVDPLTNFQGDGNTTGTRAASIHVMGMQLVSSILDDGSNVGLNSTNLAGPSGLNGLVEPGQSITYVLYAEKEGTYLMHSTAQTTGGDGDGGQITKGLFGAVNVEPTGAEYYRSQVTREDLDLATRRDASGAPVLTAGGHPVLNYDTVYPSNYRIPELRGRPILKMVDASGMLVHSDLTAIITGPNRGPFGAGVFPPVEVERDRARPFREMTVIFHDETGLVQAFDSLYESRRFAHTLHSGRDAFAINYGTGGIGSEIIANRYRLGPMWDCPECKYEEFFLTSWAVGDPAMNVDVPAAVNFSPNNPPAPGPQATKAFWPDDPSNVYHSYMNDHMKIRNLHAGPKEHHIFHLHAHQWLHTPDSDRSTYLDSQAIGPGGGYTYEITYDGGSNRNKTPGDAIFHCHFYPHFAQGMWSLWRVHDVFERGTPLDANGRPDGTLADWQSRALPDGEIAAGTPTPALVPIPTYSLAPMPTATMPGFPFYIPGEPGHRPPRPPLDVAIDTTAAGQDTLHGGLPRHVVLDGVASYPVPLSTTDFHKESDTLEVRWLAYDGEPGEQAAMAYHAQPWQPSYRFDPNTGAVQVDSFRTNGLPATHGAPYADPCVEDDGSPPGDTIRSIVYKAASFQTDVTYNKAGWHFPQHRMFALQEDVLDYHTVNIGDARPPEPLFFRANTNDCVTYHLANLIPFEYAMDDFQVRTPTDVIGQHIHLVKFDVTSSDGAANGFNYEDGSLSPDEVRERIRAIRRFNGCMGDLSGDPRDGTEKCPTPKYHPYFTQNKEQLPHEDWLGAMETIQRWFVDNVLDVNGNDRTLRTIFTHDHFGPSTHQQAGLYAGLVAEPKNSSWLDAETRAALHDTTSRFDGGPTSWQAIIQRESGEEYREFNMQIADFTLAYTEDVARHDIGAHPEHAVNPPGKMEANPVLPLLLVPPDPCPNGDAPPCPELISADDPGTMVVNYRNEPLALRVRDPGSNDQANGAAGDLGRAFSSRVRRADARLNQFGPYGRRPGIRPRDPFTPLIRVREDDPVQIRLLVGAHEEGHNVLVHGTEWLFEPADSTSGYRNNQMMGISEHYEFLIPPLVGNCRPRVDLLYQAGSATDDLWNGLWGLVRVYRAGGQPNLKLCRGWMAYEEVAIDEHATVYDYDSTQKTSSLVTTSEATAAASGTTSDYDPPPALTQNTGSAIALDATITALSADPTLEESSALDPGIIVSQDTAVLVASSPATATVTPDPGSESKVDSGDPQKGAPLSTNDPLYAQMVQAGGAPGASIRQTTNGVRDFDGFCPWWSDRRTYDVSAVAARKALPGGRIVYNSRTLHGGPLVDTAGILYVLTDDLTSRDTTATLNPGVPIEPLVLRAEAGECVQVVFRNLLPGRLLDPDGYNTLPMVVDSFNANHVGPSRRVGLHAQLAAYDAHRSDGAEVGFNRATTVAPNGVTMYQWYAGEIVARPGGQFVVIPVEYGATNLLPADRIEQPGKGAIGALIIEPAGSSWTTDANSRAIATVTRYDGTTFRELVTLFQDDVNMQFGSNATLPSRDHAGDPITESFSAGDPVPNLAESDDPEDSGQKGLNYRTEPLWIRLGFAPDAPLEMTRDFNFTRSLTDHVVEDSVLGTNVFLGRPETPILTAVPGDEVRFRILQPGGHARNHVFQVHGHAWEELPYGKKSTVIDSNPLSEVKGARDGHGPGNHFDVVLKNGAGGLYQVVGEYLYRDQASFQFDGGIWGIFRVEPKGIVIGPVDEKETTSEETTGGTGADGP